MNSSKKFPPLVPRWVSIKRAFKFLKNPIPMIMDNMEVYGNTYGFHVGGGSLAVLTRDPQVIQHVLQKNNKNYHKSQIQSKTVGYFIGQGLLTSNGPYWLKQRRLIQPGFHRKKLEALFTIIQQEIDAHFDQISKQKTSSLDIHDEMQNLTFQIITRSIFSTSIDEDELRSFRHKIDRVQEFIIKMIRLPFFVPWYVVSGQKRLHKKLAEETKAFMFQLIEQRRKSNEHFDDLLDMLLAARYEDDGSGMSTEQIVDESLILFIAGHETSSNAMAWVFYLLTQNAAVLKKMKEDIDRVLGDKKLTMDDLPQLDYSRQIIEEGMRLYPPAWIIDRVALEDDEVNGFFIPKGTMVAAFIYGTHHWAELWEDAEQFKPERFTKENKKKIGNYQYFPFGGGPRLCIGNHMAMMEMQMILIEFIRRFDFELLNQEAVKIKTLITLQPEQGINLKLAVKQN